MSMSNLGSTLIARGLAEANAEFAAIKGLLPIEDPGDDVWATWPITTTAKIKMRHMIIIGDTVGPTSSVSLMVDQQRKFTITPLARGFYKIPLPWDLPQGVKIWLRDEALAAPPFDLIPGNSQGIEYAAIIGYASR